MTLTVECVHSMAKPYTFNSYLHSVQHTYNIPLHTLDINKHRHIFRFFFVSLLLLGTPVRQSSDIIVNFTFLSVFVLFGGEGEGRGWVDHRTFMNGGVA